MTNQEMWAATLGLAEQAPYVYSSERYSHLDAAERVAKDCELSHERLDSWREFYQERTKHMSNYAGAGD